MIRAGYRYKAFNVKHLTSNKGYPYVKFSIGDSKKGSDGTYYNNGWYNVTAFENMQNLSDGMHVKIVEIQSIEKFVSRNGNESINLVIRAEIDGANDNNGQSFASQQSQFQTQQVQPQMQQAQTYQNDNFANMQNVELNNTFDVMEDEIQF